MTPPSFDTYLDHLRTESRRFRDVLADCDPAARVPSCPDWDAADLLWHLAEVQWSWATTVRTRPLSPDERDVSKPVRPATYDELLAVFDEHSAALVHELEAADPAETAWTWASEQTVGFTYRRQAHEALIHRVDAEQTAGVDSAPFDPALAADGVLEVIDVMYGGHPPWGRFDGGPQHLRVDVADTGDALWVQLGTFSGTDPDSGTSYADEDDLGVVPDPGRPADAVLGGTAEALDRWLWNRSDEAGITSSGDPEVLTQVRAILGQPLN